MKNIFAQIDTPSWYPNFCVAMIIFGWLPFFFSQPMMHGGTLATETFGWAGLVIGGYCSLELLRSSTVPWRTATALLGCIIYGALVGMGLYFAVPFIPRLFAF